MAMTKGIDPKECLGPLRASPMAADTIIYQGSMVALNSSGYAIEPTETTGLLIVGVAIATFDNSGGDAGDKDVTYKFGTFIRGNSAGGDELTLDEVGDVVYAVDGDTVAKTATSKSIAGVLVGIDDLGPMVTIGLYPNQVGLLAANNLSDVGSAATARASIGADTFDLNVLADTLVGSSAKRFGFVAPRAMTFTGVRTVLLGAALTTGNATLTMKIAGVNVTNGVVTITQAGSAIGDKDSATPTAANVAAAGDFVEFLLGGTNDAAAAQAQITVSGTY